ncbi:MAG: DUF1122 family protein [Chloroflexi bacterium]|nr:DUF1122 family protein [Chloroflexota bacterium]
MAEMAAKGWRPAAHPVDGALASLQGIPLADCRTLLLAGPTNRVGARYFQMWLQNRDGLLSHEPAVAGLYNKGSYPSTCWVEVLSTEREAVFPGQELPLSDEALLAPLVQTVPPGGHMMVEYESPAREETARALARGLPPVLTPLGYTLFRLGCGDGIRDWYISEGWAEGPRKLQGFKALNEEQHLKGWRRMAQELLDFLQKGEPSTDLRGPVQYLLQRFLKELADPQLAASIRRSLTRLVKGTS